MMVNNSEISWPSDYLAAVNAAVNRALVAPIDGVLIEISIIGETFRSHPSFQIHPDELDRSILRNKMLAATLSPDSDIRIAISKVLVEIEASGKFSDKELMFQRSVVEGKLKTS